MNGVDELVGDCSAVVIHGHSTDDDDLVQQDASCIASVHSQGLCVLGHFQPQTESVLAAFKGAKLQFGLIVVVSDGKLIACSHVDLVGSVREGVLVMEPNDHLEHVVKVLGAGDFVSFLRKHHSALTDEERNGVSDLHVVDVSSAWLVHGAIVEVEPVD